MIRSSRQKSCGPARRPLAAPQPDAALMSAPGQSRRIGRDASWPACPLLLRKRQSVIEMQIRLGPEADIRTAANKAFFRLLQRQAEGRQGRTAHSELAVRMVQADGGSDPIPMNDLI